jgi:GrpB-like predicted nucleotidyltransferase (UPF0157 family)
MSQHVRPETTRFGLGLVQGAVELVPHNPEWRRADTIRAALGNVLIDIEHIGSTSIPGIRSKPILDLMIGIGNLVAGPSLEPRMAAIGYDFAPNAGVPNDNVFGKGVARTHLAHVVEFDGPTWRHNLVFRDRLRASTGLAQQYDTLKEELAVRFSNDRASYTSAKKSFIDQVVAGR